MLSCPHCKEFCSSAHIDKCAMNPKNQRPTEPEALRLALEIAGEQKEAANVS